MLDFSLWTNVATIFPTLAIRLWVLGSLDRLLDKNNYLISNHKREL